MEKERSKFSYKLFYSPYIRTPTFKDHENMWGEADKIIKIFDEKSETKFFKKKVLYFSLYSDYKAVVKVLGKFYELDDFKLENYKNKKKLNAFEVFAERNQITKTELAKLMKKKSKLFFKIF